MITIDELNKQFGFDQDNPSDAIPEFEQNEDPDNAPDYEVVEAAVYGAREYGCLKAAIILFIAVFIGIMIAVAC